MPLENFGVFFVNIGKMVQKEEQKIILRIEPDYNFTEVLLYMWNIPYYVALR